MYGGVLYYLEDSFCGIFSYKSHVSLEFSKGHKLQDPERRLECSGKFRRHLKFKKLADVKAKQPATYIKQAIAFLVNIDPLLPRPFTKALTITFHPNSRAYAAPNYEHGNRADRAKNLFHVQRFSTIQGSASSK